MSRWVDVGWYVSDVEGDLATARAVLAKNPSARRGRLREGGGRIKGTVYMDANRNGRRDADEQGAEGVPVYLDNRYMVRTDAQGQYEFSLVAAGTHIVSIRNESLPLPWGIVGDGQARVNVVLREGLTVDFPIQPTE